MRAQPLLLEAVGKPCRHLGRPQQLCPLYQDREHVGEDILVSRVEPEHGGQCPWTLASGAQDLPPCRLPPGPGPGRSEGTAQGRCSSLSGAPGRTHTPASPALVLLKGTGVPSFPSDPKGGTSSHTEAGPRECLLWPVWKRCSVSEPHGSRDRVLASLTSKPQMPRKTALHPRGRRNIQRVTKPNPALPGPTGRAVS